MFLYVIDFEMFNNNIIKEIGVSCKYFSTGFLIRPPFTFDKLSANRQKQNFYVTANIHNISWESGTIDYHKITDLLKYFHNLDAIYMVKGSQKVNQLRILLPGACVINLEDYGCPKYTDLVNQYGFVESNYLIVDQNQCSNCPDQHNRDNMEHCAEKKARMFFQWADKNIKTKIAVRKNIDTSYDEVDCRVNIV